MINCKMQSLVYHNIMNIQALKRLLEVRGEYEASELLSDTSEASVRQITGDNWSDRYFAGRRFIVSDRGVYKPVEAA